MTDIIANGWLWIYSGSDYLKLYCEEVKVDWMFNPKIRHFEGGGHLFYDLLKRWLVFKCRNVSFISHANFSSAMDYLKDWQNAGSFTLKIVKDASNNGIEYDGDNSTYTVAIPEGGVRGMHKASPGIQDNFYKIDMLILEQVG